jgi:hypothetical protein
MILLSAVSEDEAIGKYLKQTKKEFPDWVIVIPDGCILVSEEDEKKETDPKKTALREIANKYRDEKSPSLIEWGGVSEFVFWAETEGALKQ